MRRNIARQIVVSEKCSLPVTTPSLPRSGITTKTGDVPFKIQRGSAVTRPMKVVSEVQCFDADEEMLDELYAMYLQRRLLAQYAHKKMKQELVSQTDATTQLFLRKTLIQKNVFTVRYESLKKIEKQLAQLEKLKSMEEHLDLLLELIVTNNAEHYVKNLEDKLSAVGDVLPVTNSNSKVEETLNFTSVQASYEKLKETVDQPDSTVHVVMNLQENLEALHALEDISSGQEKELNDNIIQLASLKISQELLNNQTADDEADVLISRP